MPPLRHRPRASLRAYLEHERPHLLRAYDADFLVDAVERTRNVRAAGRPLKPLRHAVAPPRCAPHRLRGSFMRNRAVVLATCAPQRAGVLPRLAQLARSTPPDLP